ncbi:hypothetical protein Tco_1021567, partial [Tanacetum coccineum]
MGFRPNQANKARWARAKPSPVPIRPERNKTDKADLPWTKQHPRKRIHVRKTQLLRTLARQGAYFDPLTDTSEISEKPNIWLTYKNGYSDTSQGPSPRVARQRITQTFSPESVISFPSLGEEDGTEGPMIIEAKMGGHYIHRMYVDGGSSSEILYEHCFNRFRPEVKNLMVPAAIPLVGFIREIIWPLGQISLLVKIGDEEHSTFAWMNFMVVRSPSPYNGIIGRQGVRKIRAIPST